MKAMAVSSSTSKIVGRLVRRSSLVSRYSEFLTTFESRLLSLGPAAGAPGRAPSRTGKHAGALASAVAAFVCHPTLGPPPRRTAPAIGLKSDNLTVGGG